MENVGALDIGIHHQNGEYILLDTTMRIYVVVLVQTIAHIIATNHLTQTGM
jgi:hypothetical protein